MKREAISNIMWRFLERTGAQGIQLVVTIILARILGPEAFGEVAIITAIISILQILVDGGLGNSLIQKKEVDELDYSSAFYFNVVVCILLYFALFFCAPIIAGFYHNNDLIPMIRTAGIVIIISGLKSVQQARVSRELKFKFFFVATLWGTAISAGVGITLAVMGYGAWALVAQYLTNALIDTLVVSISLKWFPKFRYSFMRIKKLWGYGWKLLVSNILDTTYGDFIQLLIGKFYSPSQLAFFNRGRSVPNLIVKNINTSIDSVLFPIMSAEQDHIKRVREITQKAIIVSNYLMAPLMMVIFFSAETIIRLFLTEEWLPCVFFLRVFSFIYMMQPIHTANLNAIKALGRSDYILWIEIIKKSIGFMIIIATIRISIYAVMFGYLISTLINQLVNSYPNRKLLEYSLWDQIRDICPNTMVAIFSGLCIYWIKFVPVHCAIQLIIQVMIGGTIYYCITYYTKSQALSWLRELATELKEKKR